MEVKELSIGLIEPVGGHGGMDYYDYGLAMGLQANNVEVIFYTCDETNIRKYEKVLTLLFFKKMWSARFFVKIYKYLLGHYLAIKDLKKRNVEIVHLHFFTFRSIDLVVLWYLKINNVKRVVTIHDISSFDKKASSFIEKSCFKYIQGIIVHNQSSLNTLNYKFHLSIPTVIIPHGNYLPFISDSIEPLKPTEKFRLLFFGQIKKVKGLDVLLQALSLLKKKHCQIELTIAGKSWKSDLNVYKQMISDLNIEDIVKTDFRYIPDDEVSSFYHNSDLVVLPYRVIYQSGVLLLTLSYGKPVLCSDLKPFKEIITHNENGFLFKSENPEDLALKIQEIIINKDLDGVTNNANGLIRRDYDWIKIGALTKKFYLNLIQSSAT